MRLPAQLALLNFVFWNKHTFSFQFDGPLPWFARQILQKVPDVPEVDLTGQVIMITGGNGGIGLEAAKKFVKGGAKVILACRSISRGEDAKGELLKEKENAEVEVWEVDMASYVSIMKLVERVEKELPRLDIAILGAGLYKLRFSKSDYGYELQLQVNVLGSALLSLLLVPILERSTVHRGTSRPSRLLVVNSDCHAWVEVDKSTSGSIFEQDTQRWESSFRPSQVYHRSKLYLMLFTHELSSRVDTAKVIVGECTPGFCKTGLFNDSQGIIPTIINGVVARTAEQGARTYVYAAVHATDSDFQGGYFITCKKGRTSEYSRGEDGRGMQKEIWDQTIALLEKEVPGGLNLN